MKWILTIAIALCCVVTADADVDVEASILAQEKIWAAALVADDLDTVATLMHRDFRLMRTYGDAPPISKEAYLRMRGMSASSADVTSVVVTEDAGSVVIARVTWSMDWQQEGVGKLPPRFDMIDTWIKGEDGAWQILARVSQIAEGADRAKGKE